MLLLRVPAPASERCKHTYAHACTASDAQHPVIVAWSCWLRAPGAWRLLCVLLLQPACLPAAPRALWGLQKQAGNSKGEGGHKPTRCINQ